MAGSWKALTIHLIYAPPPSAMNRLPTGQFPGPGFLGAYASGIGERTLRRCLGGQAIEVVIGIGGQAGGIRPDRPLRAVQTKVTPGRGEGVALKGSTMGS